jgi:ubiquinone/menaquinone biosynthesis C-methylase UbiE
LHFTQLLTRNYLGALKMNLTEVCERKAAFYARTAQYLRLGLDRFAEADFVTTAAGPLSSPVLDVGTGKGLTATALARQGLDVSSVDIDAVEQSLAIVLAEEAGLQKQIRFISTDASMLPFPDNHFGAAVMMDVLHHLADPSPALAEIGRVLKHAGIFILADFSAEGFKVVDSALREDGREHPVSGVTLSSVQESLCRQRFSLQANRASKFHEVSVFVKDVY